MYFALNSHLFRYFFWKFEKKYVYLQAYISENNNFIKLSLTILTKNKKNVTNQKGKQNVEK